ncbi:MAG: DNA repair protein RecO [Armatimonadota bacterium]
MATYPALCITLQCRRLREADRVLTLFSRERGKIEAVVKGVGKPKSKLTPCTQIFSLNRLLLAEGKSLDVVAQVQVVEPFFSIREDVRRMAWASYVVELVAKTSEPAQSSPELFELLRGALAELAKGTEPELIARAFEVKALALLGYGLDAEYCGACGGELSGEGLAFSAPDGAFYCERCKGSRQGIGLCAGTLRTLVALKRTPIERASRLSLPPQIRAELRRILRAHADYHVGVRLRSLEFIQQLDQA